MGKPFFFRIDAGALIDFATDPEGEGVTLLRFAKDLQKGQSDIPFIQQVIDEAKAFIDKRSDAGKKGMKNRWSKRKKDNTDITMLSNVITNDNTPVTSSSSSKEESIPYKEILQILNTETRNNYRLCDSLRRLVHARWMEGFRLEDFRHVILAKSSQWKDDPKWCNYLRPETLFSNKFNSYRQEKIVESKEDWRKGYLLGY